MKLLLINLLVRYGFIEADYTVEIAMYCVRILKWIRGSYTDEQIQTCDRAITNMKSLYSVSPDNFYLKIAIKELQEKRIAIQLSNEESVKI